MSGITDSFKDLLKSRVNLTDVVSEFTQLQRRGSSIVGCCPFHKEKTPSFYVYENDGHYHCYGCKAHGDVFDILMDKKGYSFVETIKYLCDRTGLEMPKFKSAEEADDENRYYDLLNFVAEFYHRCLYTPDAAHALSYLIDKRQLSKETIETFKLGFAPSGQKLINALEGQNFNLSDAVTLGVLKQGEFGKTYDPMRARLIFPIQNLSGKVVGFGGRTLTSDKNVAKYLNTGETPLFKKKQILYGAHTLKEHRKDKMPILCVEGYMDVIALRQAGYKRAVAALGTAFGEDHLNLMWSQNGRGTGLNPTLCFDGDQAGRESAKGALIKALPHLTSEKSIDFLVLDQNQDPDDYIKENGLGAFNALVEQRLLAFDFLFKSHFEGQVPSDPTQKAALRKKARNLCDTIGDKTLAGDWKKSVKERFDQIFYKNYQSAKQGFHKQPFLDLTKGRVHASKLSHVSVTFQKQILRWFRENPFLCDYICEQEVYAVFHDQELLSNLHKVYEQFFAADCAVEVSHEKEILMQGAVERMHGLFEKYHEFNILQNFRSQLASGDINLFKKADPTAEKALRNEIGTLIREVDIALEAL